MKNIYVLPTENPSRLILQGTKLLLSKHIEVNEGFSEFNQHIYTTSTEKPKAGNWILFTNPNSNRTFVVKCTEISDTWFDYQRQTLDMRQVPVKWAKTIVLTTDQDLIQDGVQAIDDEFLEWFVNNPSCEEVKVVQTNEVTVLTQNAKPYYKIVIPKQEATERMYSEEEVVQKLLDFRFISDINTTREEVKKWLEQHKKQ